MSTYLGIDIGTTAVKVAVIRTAYRKVQLGGLASVEIAQVGGLVEAIQTAARAVLGERGADAIATSLEGQRATVRVLGLPQSAAKSIAEVLPFELESALPFDLAESVFDWKLLPGVREKKGEELAVLVAVARVADVQARIDVLKTALSAEPERVSVGAFPVANLVPFLPGFGEGAQAGAVAIVDLGTETSDVILLKNGEPVFARTVGLGTKGLPGTAAKLARELRTTIAAHRAQGGEPPTRLYLCGGGSYVSGAQAFLSSALELPVEAIPMPTLDATNAPITQEQVSTMAKFAKAIGLALALAPRAAGMNLRRGPLAFERGFAWVREKIPVLAGLAAVILVSFLFSAWAQLYAKSKERAVLESALSQVTKEVLGEETSSPARANDLLTAQTSLNDEDPLPHADAFDVMVKLSDAIPQSMVSDIDELNIEKGHVIVHGIVGSIPEAQQIRTNVAAEPCFQDPHITRTNAQVGGTNQKYVLEFDIKCPQDMKGAEKKKAAAAASASGASSGPAGK
jgi:general secretion pathway protein L